MRVKTSLNRNMRSAPLHMFDRVYPANIYLLKVNNRNT